MQMMSPNWRGRRDRRRGRKLLARDVTTGRLWYRDKKLLLLRRYGVGIHCFRIVTSDVVLSPEMFSGAWKELSAMKRKKQPSAKSDVNHLAPMESEVFGRFLSILAHMADLRYEDGSPRAPGTVLMKTMGAAWVVVCKDPDECLQMTIIQATFDDAVTLTALMLESEDAPWETDPWAAAAKAKKRK